MEKKQLNFNAPLISVRRMSSIVSQPEDVVRKTIGKTLPNRPHIPRTKRDVNGSTRPSRPVAIPFVWEQTPGQLKPGNQMKIFAQEEPSETTPKLPPGRTTRDSIRFYSGERPRGQNLHGYQAESPNWNHDHSALLDALVDSMYSKGESEPELGWKDSPPDSPGVFSSPESSSFSCSVSGVSGYQGGPDEKPSGTFSVDLQTRDFMIDRFLHAAKAVVLDNPQYVLKKELSMKEEEPKAVPIERKPPNIGPCYSHYTEDYDNASETEEDESNIMTTATTTTPKKHKSWGKSWKISPWLCVKNSLWLLNPLPGIKRRSQTPARTPPLPPAKDMKRFSRIAHSGPLPTARNAYSGPLDKQVCDAVYNKRFHSGELYKSGGGGGDRRMSTRVSYSRDSSPNRHTRSGAISPYRNVTPRSPFNEGSKFLGVPREVAARRKSDVEEKTACSAGVVGPTWDQSPLPPPLPKTPSESWLWRALPSSAPSQNRRRRSKGGDHKSAASKWETIVKSSYSHHDHARYSEELVQRKRV
ncbi:unnamed protein product [Cuscuta campestris]|uniref:Uncharacterized protein n=1 Tax=Cuscuta campestris TaxID=132261 RepID=A0A484MZ34_9ASTE|nr:unnamed protein product [Cuscuta campestris]